MEARLAEKESQNGRDVFSGTVGTQLYLVANFLWTASTCIGIDRDYIDVDDDHRNNQKILPTIPFGLLLARTVCAVGQFCHTTECSDCISKLIRKYNEDFV